MPSHRKKLRANNARPPGRPFLSLNDAAFRLGERLVFPNTSWVFSADEHWAVLGPNGAGKSLFADCIRGALPLVQGALTHHFRPAPGTTAEDCIGLVSFDERRRELHGAVVQSRWNSLEDDLAVSVEEYLSWERVMAINPFEIRPGAAREQAQFERRRRRALRLLYPSGKTFEQFQAHSLLSLSNGERQRLELLRALCRPLRLLILDEPFAGLDAAGRAEVRKLLERLMQTPLRLLLLTTRPEDLPPLCTHALWLEDCRVAQLLERRQWAAVRENPPLRRRPAKLPSKTCTSRPNSAAPGEDTSAALVELRNVTVRYGSRTILNGFSWAVREGESWALLGPNGSGKTTLLSLITADNPQAYSNELLVFGRRRGAGESLWHLKQRIGWVSPELQVHFPQTTTCLETVESGFFDSNGLFETPSTRQRRAAREWLSRFDLLRFADTPLFALSLGLQRMALLARALVKKPRLLLLDEPCQGLDLDHRKLFIVTVDRLIRDHAATVIYVTHRRDEIPPSIHRLLRLRSLNFG